MIRLIGNGLALDGLDDLGASPYPNRCGCDIELCDLIDGRWRLADESWLNGDYEITIASYDFCNHGNKIQQATMIAFECAEDLVYFKLRFC